MMDIKAATYADLLDTLSKCKSLVAKCENAIGLLMKSEKQPGGSYSLTTSPKVAIEGSFTSSQGIRWTAEDYYDSQSDIGGSPPRPMFDRKSKRPNVNSSNISLGKLGSIAILKPHDHSSASKLTERSATVKHAEEHSHKELTKKPIQSCGLEASTFWKKDDEIPKNTSFKKLETIKSFVIDCAPRNFDDSPSSSLVASRDSVPVEESNDIEQFVCEPLQNELELSVSNQKSQDSSKIIGRTISQPKSERPAIVIAEPVKKSSYLSELFTKLFLLPGFDSKGVRARENMFEKQDIESLNFLTNGLHPKSIFNTVWEAFASCCFLVVLWGASVLVAFSNMQGIASSEGTRFSLATSALFLCDSIILAITPTPKVASNMLYNFREYESLRPNLKEWITNFGVFQLLFEVLTVLPFDILLASTVPNSQLFLLVRLLRLYRLPKMAERCSFFKQIISSIDFACGMSLSKVIPMLIAMLTFIHCHACLIYYLARSVQFEGWPLVWSKFSKATTFEYYCWSLFLSVGQMFPTSMNPQTPVEQLCGVLFTVAAAVLYAAFLGAISSVTLSINPAGKLYSNKLEELNDYVKWKNLKPETVSKLFKYYDIKYRGKYFEEELLLADMNESLRAEILLQNTRSLIEKVPFLRREALDGRDEIFIGRIATALTAHYFVEGDYITKQGDSGNDMFFLLSGKVDVLVNTKKVVSLYDGAYIGEVALISKVLRTATVQAAKPCILYRLTHMDFHRILDEFQDMKVKIAQLTLEKEKSYVN